mgnify:CR=1 FL=1
MPYDLQMINFKLLTKKNINFKLEHGMSLGIFGKTGSGKSSLAQILCRLYEPSDGEILINNYKIISILLVCLSLLFIVNGSNLIDGFNGLLIIHFFD